MYRFWHFKSGHQYLHLNFFLDLEMSQLSPDYGWWKNPTPELLLKVYIFNITNSEDFMEGKANKLKLSEIGPVVFREVIEHKDVVFHRENSTMSYTVSRHLVFKESANIEGILNQTIYVM
jgi:CD36 family